jgi:hypothetical protein
VLTAGVIVLVSIASVTVPPEPLPVPGKTVDPSSLQSSLTMCHLPSITLASP